MAVRQVALELVTAGLASASFCWIARADSYAFSASAGLPVSLQQDGRCCCGCAARSLWNSVIGGVGVGQLLLDRQRLPVGDQGVLLVADLVGQVAQVEAGLGQAAQRFGPGVVVGLEAVAQGLEERQRLLQERLAERFEPGLFFSSGLSATASRNFFTASIACSSRCSARLVALASAPTLRPSSSARRRPSAAPPRLAWPDPLGTGRTPCR